MPGWLLINCPVDLGELSLRENWALISPRDVPLSSSVSNKAIIKKRNSNGDMLSPCLTPTLNSMNVSNLPTTSLTMLLLYMLLIADNSLGGAPNFPSMAMSNACLEVSKAPNRSTNATHVGRLWLCLRYISVLIVNVPSWHPTPGVDPNWHFTPGLLIILNLRPHMILM